MWTRWIEHKIIIKYEKKINNDIKPNWRADIAIYAEQNTEIAKCATYFAYNVLSTTNSFFVAKLLLLLFSLEIFSVDSICANLEIETWLLVESKTTFSVKPVINLFDFHL